MVTILLFEEYLYKKREEFYGLYRLCGGIFGVLKLFVETSAGLVITKKKQNMGQEPQIYANIITTTFYFIQKLNKILFWLVGYTCLCSIIISYVFVAWCCWYRIRFFKFHMYANGYYLLLLLLCMIDWYEIFFVFIDIIVAEDTSTLLSSNVVRSVCIGTCLYYCSKCSNDSFPAINFEKQKILCAMMSTWEYSNSGLYFFVVHLPIYNYIIF